MIIKYRNRARPEYTDGVLIQREDCGTSETWWVSARGRLYLNLEPDYNNEHQYGGDIDKKETILLDGELQRG